MALLHSLNLFDLVKRENLSIFRCLVINSLACKDPILSIKSRRLCLRLFCINSAVHHNTMHMNLNDLSKKHADYQRFALPYKLITCFRHRSAYDCTFIKYIFLDKVTDCTIWQQHVHNVCICSLSKHWQWWLENNWVRHWSCQTMEMLVIKEKYLWLIDICISEQQT